MRKMNEYERHAYLYSAWSALLVPCLLTIWITWSILRKCPKTDLVI